MARIIRRTARLKKEIGLKKFFIFYFTNRS